MQHNLLNKKCPSGGVNVFFFFSFFAVREVLTIKFSTTYSIQEQTGKVWSVLSHQGCQCLRRCVDKGGGGPPTEGILCNHFFLEHQAVSFSLHEHLNSGAWTDTTRKGFKIILSVGTSTPPIPSVCLSRHRHHVIKQSKTGRWEGLGARLHTA